MVITGSNVQEVGFPAFRGSKLERLDAPLWFQDNPTSGIYITSDERRLACGLSARDRGGRVKAGGDGLRRSTEHQERRIE